MKKFFALVASLILVAGVANKAAAQDYNNAIGLRIGYGVSLDYKHVMGSNAIDAMLSWSANGNGIYAAAFYEWTTPVIADGFVLYYGPGVNLGLFEKSFALGVGGIVGLEYKFPSIPLALSLDWAPRLNILPGLGFGWDSFGLGVKFTF